MNWAIKVISKTLMTKISHISWGSYDKGFYGNSDEDRRFMERYKKANMLHYLNKTGLIDSKVNTTGKENIE